jgi:uracil-DNA glycosylase family 4
MVSTVPSDIEQINREVIECTKCELHKERKNAVPGDGNFRAKIMFIGEAPGRDEDLQGRPFVGAAGKLLTQLLLSIGLKREDIYITNIVKCRPPENRQPRVSEIATCSHYLDRQIEIINPRLLCPMGNTALKFLLGKNASISGLHGRLAEKREGRVVFPLYHPAAALYTGKLISIMKEDFKGLAREVGRAST